jgi:hypothetical protein
MKKILHQRWNGEPRDLGDVFVVTKESWTAHCRVITHPVGWECRLVVERELVQSKVCRTEDEVSSTCYGWKAALLEKDWR